MFHADAAGVTKCWTTSCYDARRYSGMATIMMNGMPVADVVAGIVVVEAPPVPRQQLQMKRPGIFMLNYNIVSLNLLVR